MEKLLLSAVRPRDKLYVVQHKYIGVSKLCSEFRHCIAADAFYHFVSERFSSYVYYVGVGIVFYNFIAYRVHEVRFSQTDAAVKEQRIVNLSRSFGYGL